MTAKRAGYFGHLFHPDMYTLTRFGVTIYHIHVCAFGEEIRDHEEGTNNEGD
jgi:hypothetical protein